jgi:hypothetical protein
MAAGVVEDPETVVGEMPQRKLMHDMTGGEGRPNTQKPKTKKVHIASEERDANLLRV